MPADFLAGADRLLPNGGMRKDNALQSFEKREGKTVGRNECAAPPIGARREYCIDPRVERELVDASAGKRPAVAESAEAGEPEAVCGSVRGSSAWADCRRMESASSAASGVS